MAETLREELEALAKSAEDAEHSMVFPDAVKLYASSIVGRLYGILSRHRSDEPSALREAYRLGCEDEWRRLSGMREPTIKVGDYWQARATIRYPDAPSVALPVRDSLVDRAYQLIRAVLEDDFNAQWCDSARDWIEDANRYHPDAPSPAKPATPGLTATVTQPEIEFCTECGTPLGVKEPSPAKPYDPLESISRQVDEEIPDAKPPTSKQWRCRGCGRDIPSDEVIPVLSEDFRPVRYMHMARTALCGPVVRVEEET